VTARPSVSPTTAAPRRLPGLELLRFAAAFAVLIWHYQHFFYGNGRPRGWLRSDQPFYFPLRLFYDFGSFGVHVFWGISGFIFFWLYRERIARRGVSGRQFFVLRLSRLYPLHVVTLVVVAVLQLLYQAERGVPFIYKYNDLKHFGLHLLMANGWGAPNVYSFNGPTWSVSLEVFVYVAFFLLTRYVTSSPVINVLLVAAWPIAWHHGVRSLAFDALVLFYAGGLAALAMQRLARTRLARPVGWLACLAAVVGLLLLREVRIHEPKHLPYALMAWIPVAVYAAASEWVPRAWAKGADVLGSLTYASYLVHFPLQVLIMYVAARTGTTPPARNGAFLIAYLATVLTISFFVYRRFELPMQNYLREHLGARSRAEMPAVEKADGPVPA
jgi:peptidoglycan/LPS O-acetylase OafA/YrhL